MDIQELILRYAQDDSQKILGRRLCDLAARSEKEGWFVSTGFISPSEQAFCSLILPKIGCGAALDGGFDGAERACAILFPEYLDAPTREQPDFPIAALSVEHALPLTHRDFLGAALGLGIKREAIGDILVGTHKSIILISRSMLPFFLTSFSKAGKTYLSVSELSLSEIIPPEQRFEEQHNTVASLRIDSVLSAGFRISRETAQQSIKRGLVQLNHREILVPSKEVRAGDILTLRGKGKILLSEVNGESRKGRTWITIKRYL